MDNLKPSFFSAVGGVVPRLFNPARSMKDMWNILKINTFKEHKFSEAPLYRTPWEVSSFFFGIFFSGCRVCQILVFFMG